MLGYTNKRFIEELILVGLRLRGCIADHPTSARHPLRPGNSQFRFGFFALPDRQSLPHSHRGALPELVKSYERQLYGDHSRCCYCRFWPVSDLRHRPGRLPFYASVCSAISKASSTSMPR
jgi:hypothetical protein